jgi:hypothetical protein
MPLLHAIHPHTPPTRLAVKILHNGRLCRAYWVSFVPLRLVLYPMLLVRFWVVLREFPLWERLLVVICQLLLCFFNFGAHLLLACPLHTCHTCPCCCCQWSAAGTCG